MKKTLLRASTLVAVAGCVLAAEVAPDPVPEFRSFLLLHDWFGRSPVATPSFIREHRDFLDSQPFDGLAVYLRKPDLTMNVTTSVLGRTPVDFEAMAEVLSPLKGLEFGNLTENFAAVVGGNPPDFMEDWFAPIANFARLSRAARQAGLKGIYFDNEGYRSPWADYPRGVLHPEKPVAQYQEQARRRGRQVMEAVAAEFPEIVVILLHGPYLSEPGAPAPLFPQWQTRNELLGPFFAGFVEGAGSRATIVDGGELYHLRTDDQFRRSGDWRRRVLPSTALDCDFLSPEVRERWGDRVSIGFGIIDRPYKGLRMDPGILATTVSRAMRHADRYVWLYVEGPTFLKPPGAGGAPREWVEAIRGARARKAN